MWIYCQRTQNFKKLLGRDTSFGFFLGTTMTKNNCDKDNNGYKKQLQKKSPPPKKKRRKKSIAITFTVWVVYWSRYVKDHLYLYLYVKRNVVLNFWLVQNIYFWDLNCLDLNVKKKKVWPSYTRKRNYLFWYDNIKKKNKRNKKISIRQTARVNIKYCILQFFSCIITVGDSWWLISIYKIILFHQPKII